MCLKNFQFFPYVKVGWEVGRPIRLKCNSPDIVGFFLSFLFVVEASFLEK
jgi:hypothetical protein